MGGGGEGVGGGKVRGRVERGHRADWGWWAGGCKGEYVTHCDESPRDKLISPVITEILSPYQTLITFIVIAVSGLSVCVHGSSISYRVYLRTERKRNFLYTLQNKANLSLVVFPPSPLKCTKHLTFFPLSNDLKTHP